MKPKRTPGWHDPQPQSRRDTLWFLLALIVFALFMALIWTGTPA